MKYQTKEHYKRNDVEADREHGPNRALETYYNRDDESSEVCLTEGERDDFEEELDIKLMSADLLHSEVFDLLVTWIKEGGLLHED